MRSVPWWQLATLTLLVVAFILSVSAGHTIEAVIVGVLVVPSLVLVGAWIYEMWHDGAS